MELARLSTALQNQKIRLHFYKLVWVHVLTCEHHAPPGGLIREVSDVCFVLMKVERFMCIACVADRVFIM